MSHKSTLNVIDKLVQGFDTLPQNWRDKLMQNLPVWNFLRCLVSDLYTFRMTLMQILMIWIMITIVDWVLL